MKTVDAEGNRGQRMDSEWEGDVCSTTAPQKPLTKQESS